MKPRVLLSKCLASEKCRWDGDLITDPFFESYKETIEFIKICPECEAGMGVPRDPIRIILNKGEKILIQPKTGKDLTEKFKTVFKQYIGKLTDLDGIILKSKSPSCGIGDAKVYVDREREEIIGRTDGIFAEEVIRQFSNKARISNKKLLGFLSRTIFLTRIYLSAMIRNMQKTKGRK